METWGPFLYRGLEGCRQKSPMGGAEFKGRSVVNCSSDNLLGLGDKLSDVLHNGGRSQVMPKAFGCYKA